jgi:hypothetical protein
MNKSSQPFINLAHNAEWANADTDFGVEPTEVCKLGRLWQSTLENQACFISEYTNSVLSQLVRTRQLMTEQVKQVSEYTEHVILTMTNTACRAVAIALHARRDCHDRRVFPLHMPANRRFETECDRRISISNGENFASN